VIRAIVFDLDGTLVDSLPGITDSVNRVLGEMGREPKTPREVRASIGNGVDILARRVLGQRVEEKARAWFVEAFRSDYAETWPEGTTAYSGISDALEKLAASGIPMAIWSNKPHYFTVETVRRIFPGFPFAAVFGERDGIPRKPDPGAASEFLAALGHSVAETAMVGDSPVDMECGQNAGFAKVAVTWGYRDRDQLAAAHPDHWVESPAELPKLSEF
jgi:phosphoglycolate phosphatase